MRQDLWTEQQLMVAMNLYTRLPFGKFHSRNPEIIKVASAIDRTPSALAMKLSNFASLDPAHQKRGVKGLKSISQMDKDIWLRFERDWTGMALLSEQVFEEVVSGDGGTDDVELDYDRHDYTGYEQDSIEHQRLGQQFFRRAVLVAYQWQCCVTKNPIPALLTASHILPWSHSENNRLNPKNGLCLAKTQDAAFDRGLITIDADFRLVVSKDLKDYYEVGTIVESFGKHEGRVISLPHRYWPDTSFLEYHRENVFIG